MKTIQVFHSSKPKRLVISISLVLLIIFIVLSIIFSTNPGTNEENNSLKFKMVSQVANSETIKTFLKIFAIFGYISFMMLITLIVFNFANQYKSFLLFNVISIGVGLSSIIKLLLQVKPLFPRDLPIENITCDVGWGLPSTQILVSTMFYLSLTKIILSSFPHGLRLKVILYIIDFIIIIGVLIITAFEGYYEFGYCILSLVLGLGLYLFIFEGLNIEVNDGNQFYSIIKHKVYFYFIIYLIFSVFGLLLYFIRMSNNLPIECDVKFFSFSVLKKGEVKYSDSCLLYLAFFFGSLFNIIGIKCELHFIFKDHDMNWIQFNFFEEDFENVSEDTFLLSNISITKDTKWNNTSLIKGIVRLIILIIIVGIACLPFLFLMMGNKIHILIILGILVPVSLVCFTIFFVSKIILLKLGCINETLFSMLHDK